MKILKIVPIIFLTVIAVLQLSCDERTPTEDTSSNYTMTMTTQPVAGNDLSGENVGEMVANGASSSNATISCPAFPPIF